MIRMYKTDDKTGKLNSISKPTKGCWIDIVEPTDNELVEISETANVDMQLLRYPLDVAEKAHIDFEDENILIVVDAPITEIKDDKKSYTTLPLGILVVRDDILITISHVKIDAIESLLLNTKAYNIETDKKSRFIFKILFDISQDYIRYLTYINKDLEAFEEQMEKTMRNKELMRLMSFQKSMIYFNASVKANQVVLEKLNRGKTIKLYEEDEEILEDTIIENRQAIEMIGTYSEILNGIVEIFGTVVSNNLNMVMKFLTSITIIIAVPTMIASFLGMNVEFPFNTNIMGFVGVMAVSVICTLLASLWLKKKDML